MIPQVVAVSAAKRTFFRVESSSVTLEFGKAAASGTPGKPAPVPISSILLGSNVSGKPLRVARESSRWSVT